ncbi:TIGR03752 family integrating conjugative element protein (plasmid) [Aeromonas media]|uniref:TIGR03752 family integrating conjugative element protein n=2 Tax=Aeromonas TaxID=642 RepID=A0ABX6P0X7_AERME|nr:MULTISPECIES: TIGR03752 family integrating conjugative element protein [Aeromonas]ASI21455.1 integrating conjugative element protein [Aeromonas salmonicida]QJT41517.1 TIGR03752 family integrating conjugative element protein [Aeromonas media]QLI59083.1 TIGR03752 family integrating conjugative element protein [Aeromonas caviae]QLI60310.1 TIGR03752 family integrating conjugative element protein [Aeromonas caviae]HDN9373721.1 TIGR03752 family integrating conjugative element protein [Aeromonas s
MSGVMVGENPMLKIGVGVVLVGAIVVGYKTFTAPEDNHADTIKAEQGEGEGKVKIERRHTRLGADADTPETSVEALAKAVTDLSSRLVQVEEGSTTSKNLQPPVAPPVETENPTIIALKQELDALKSKLPPSENSEPYQPAVETVVDPYPERAKPGKDFGLEQDEAPAGNGRKTIDLPTVPNLFNPNGSGSQSVGSASLPADGDEGVEWIIPSDAQRVTDEQTGKDVIKYPKFKGSGYRNLHTSRNTNSNLMTRSDDEEKDSLVPIYTIPENSSFLGSVGATALIGRVPLNNQVTDPFPFKVVVGQKNLATNGIKIPNLQGMVVSGLARGDYTLKCLYGQINSVTYTFIDGTIRTVSSKGKEEGEGLGYLADYQGVPCITGKYITNLPSYLAQTMGINTFAGMAEAFANGQAEITKNTDGSSSSSVVGESNSINYMLGKGIGKGVQSGSDALAERQQGAYDAVYVPPGTRVEIHLTSQIDIDYDKKGRKVSHVQPTNHYSNNRGFD